MSYDVSLHDGEGAVCQMAELIPNGGTYAVDGSRDCDFNITYNYAEVFGSLVRELHNVKASDSLPRLKAFVDAHPNAKPYTRDYWAPTIGNAVAAIRVLVSFAEAHPDATWRIS